MAADSAALAKSRLDLIMILPYFSNRQKHSLKLPGVQFPKKGKSVVAIASTIGR